MKELWTGERSDRKRKVRMKRKRKTHQQTDLKVYSVEVQQYPLQKADALGQIPGVRHENIPAIL